MDNQPSPPARPRGRPARGFTRFNLYLDPEVAEWAKAQPEGLSGLVRLLLAAERQRRARAAGGGGAAGREGA